MAASATATVGGLVGRDGARWPLRLPVTLIGSGPDCDVRLEAAGVAAVHCMVVATPAGPAVRAVAASETRVNGLAKAAALLSDGDDLSVGSYELRLEWRGRKGTGTNTTPKPATVRAGNKDQDRARARKAAARLLKRLRGRLVAAEREQVALAKAAGAATEARNQIATEWDRLRAEAGDHSGRVTAAWQLVADAQTRLVAEREQLDQEIVDRFRLLDSRDAALGEDRERLAAEAREFDEHCQAVRDEVGGLARRADHLRDVVADLERQRAMAAADVAPAFVPEAIPVMAPVPLDRRDDRSAEELLALLHYREQEVERERQAVAAERAAAQRLAADAADRRAIADERAAAVEAARDEWQRAEAKTVRDLEVLARELAAREHTIAAREASADRAEVARRENERGLAVVSAALDQWQTGLTKHEARMVAAREDADRVLAARRADLDEVCRVWGEVRTREREQVRAELARSAESRAEWAVSVAALDAKRKELFSDVTRVAALAMAVDEARQEFEKSAGTPRAVRRLRVLQRRWEGRFRRTVTDLERRSATLATESAMLNDRHRELTQIAHQLIEQRATLADALQNSDRQRLDAERPQSGTTTSTNELSALRAAAVRAAATLYRGAERPGVVVLQRA